MQEIFQHDGEKLKLKVFSWLFGLVPYCNDWLQQRQTIFLIADNYWTMATIWNSLNLNQLNLPKELVLQDVDFCIFFFKVETNRYKMLCEVFLKRRLAMLIWTDATHLICVRDLSTWDRSYLAVGLASSSDQ